MSRGNAELGDGGLLAGVEFDSGAGHLSEKTLAGRRCERMCGATGSV